MLSKYNRVFIDMSSCDIYVIRYNYQSLELCNIYISMIQVVDHAIPIVGSSLASIETM